MTAAERLVLILVADRLLAFFADTPGIERLKEARHALDAEAYWTAPRDVPPILHAEPDPDAA